MNVQVLVVDDEHDVADLFRQQFRRELRSGKFLMDFAYSGAEALEHIAIPSDVQLILMLSDINMPGMNGLELLPKVRELRPDVPVIMVTAYGDPQTRQKAVDKGAAGFLTKPVDFDILRQEIANRVSSFEGAAPSQQKLGNGELGR
jgi:CheY-like chemotaxis protein